MAHKALDGVLVGEDADDLGAAFDLAVEVSEPVGRVDFRPIRLGKARIGEHVGFGLVHQTGDPWNGRVQLSGDLASWRRRCLRAPRLSIGPKTAPRIGEQKAYSMPIHTKAVPISAETDAYQVGVITANGKIIDHDALMSQPAI
jgi:hypothetical protein